jgi:SprB repeat
MIKTERCLSGSFFLSGSFILLPFFFLSFLYAPLAHAQCSITISTAITNVTCFNGTTGQIVVTPSGGTGPYQYQLAEAGAGAWQSSNTFTALQANNYPVSVKDATGCTQTIYVTLTQPAALVANYTAADATCTGSNNGSIAIATTGGTSPYTFNWAKNGTAGFATTASISSLSPASYLLTVSDANGCSTSPIINQQVKPIIGLTGFNADVIANGTNVASNAAAATSEPLDAGGAVYYASGYSNPSGTVGASGLPSTGSFTSAQTATRGYQLASYSANNSLVLMSSSAGIDGSVVSGTLTFPSPYQSPYATLYVVGTSGNGTGVVNYTVNYSDATTSTGSLNFPDWSLAAGTASTVRALGGLDRVTYSAASPFDGATSFNLWEAPITVASANKVVNSVLFTWSSAGTARVNLFAITGYTSTTFGIRINDGPTSSVVPSVAITSSAAANTFCSGQTVTFTAAPTNGGAAPAYQWKLSGSNAGTNSPTYTNSALANAATVSVVITPSGLTCLSPATATSNTLTMTLGTVAASVTTAATATSICSGSAVTFTATPGNGGSTPSYQWKVGVTNVGTNSPTFTSSSLANGNNVSVAMTSGISCATGSPSTSTPVTMSVTTTATPTVSISSVPGVTFSSAITSGGTTPGYQWFLNGTTISSANAATYFISAPTLGNVYSLKLTSNYSCSTAPAAMSNYITVTPGTLPILLELYTLAVSGNSVVMKWTTSEEDNNQEFFIQRTTPALNSFATVGTVPATNNQSGSSYRFLDVPALPGTYLYRLVQQDLDGRQQIFSTKEAIIAPSVDWQVADQGASWLLFSGNSTYYSLFTIQGNLIEQGSFSGSKVILKPASSGIYLLRMEYNGEVFTRELIKR